MKLQKRGFKLDVVFLPYFCRAKFKSFRKKSGFLKLHMSNRLFIFFILFAENFTYTERKAGK